MEKVYRKYWKSFILTVTIMIWQVLSAHAVVYFARASGNFSAAGTWSSVACGGAASAVVPGAADDIIVCSGFTVSVTANAPIKNITIQNGGVLQTGTAGGGANKTLTVSGTFSIQNGGLYIHNNNQLAATTIFAGNEVFSPASTIRVDKWSSTADQIVTGVASNFGNLTLNWNPGLFYWNNHGLGFTRTVQGNLIVQNACATYLDNVAGNRIFTIGGSLTVNDGFLRFKQVVAGDITINVGATTTVSGTAVVNSYLYGIYQENGKMTLNTNAINVSNGTFYGIYNGDGFAQFNVTTVMSQSGGDFRGIQNNTTFTAGIASFQVGSVNFTGGVFLGNYGCHVLGQTVQFNVTGNMNVSFAVNTDIFAIVRLATLSTTASTHALNFTVGGNLSITGGIVGEFNSNNGTGLETVTITGNLIVSNGNNYFNVVPGFGGNGHAVTMLVNGALQVSGGNTFLSSETGALNCTIAGGATISGGTLSAKGQVGVGTLNFNSFYNQSAGTFYLYNNAAGVSSTAIVATVLGDFSQSGGVINFSNNAASTAVNVITLKGSNYAISGTGSMTRAGAGAAASFGLLQFNRNGIINFSRSGSHSIQQVKQVVMPVCTVDVVSGNVQIASHATAATDYLSVSNTAVLDLRGNQVFSNALAVNSGVQITDGGRLRITHPSGLFNNTALAAFNSSGALNYFLGAVSVVEYYGNANQVMTGINVGLATLAQHKYGIVEVNQITPGSWVAPTNIPSVSGNVFVRTELRLTSGELNLVNAAGNPLTGGRIVTVENGLPGGISRVNGYVRSEARDYSGAIDWIIGANTGLHILPFGYAAASYIPVKYDVASGNAGTVRFSTYNTPATNLPWPPLVLNLNSLIGLLPDNRDATSDRFWLIAPSGAPVVTLSLNYQASELAAAPYNSAVQMRAQHYNSATNRWQPSLPGQTALAFEVTIPGVSTQPIWALSNAASPLPVKWLYFNATDQGKEVLLNWGTAQEEFNDYFTVERSADFVNIRELMQVPGALVSNQPLQYSYVDKAPLSGVSYYRIRQTDLNGEVTYTDWESINKTAGKAIALYPNPASDFIMFTNRTQEAGLIQLFDVSGRIVLSRKVDVSEKQMTLMLSSLISGIYQLQFSTKSEVITERIVLQ